MPVVFLITIVAVLVGIFFAATGRGGELAYEQADHAPLDLGPVTAADVALLCPPTALWGYNMQVTDEALDQIARAMRERDVTIAYLQEQLASAGRDGSYTEYTEPRDVRAPQAAGLAPMTAFPGLADTPAEPDTIEDPSTADSLGTLPGPLDDFLHAETPEDPETPEVPETSEVPEALEAPETPLVLRASSATAPPTPESHDTTQPSEVQEPTQPSAALAPDEAREPHGPQGDFNAHDWWAEQREAARQEGARPPAGTGEGQNDDPLAAAEEQGW